MQVREFFCRASFDDGWRAHAIQTFIRAIYKSTAWLSPAESRFLSEQGMRFLRRYSDLADASRDRRKCLFAIQPKAHVIHHLCVQLHTASQEGTPCLSPAVFSAQADEDCIGRGSRLSRRVTAAAPALERVVSRYLQAACHQWLDLGLLVRPG